MLYLAWRQSDADGKRAQVVLKPIPVPQDGELRERAWEELQLATHLKHETIAKVHCMATAPDRTVYIVMENMLGMYLMTALDLSLLLGAVNK